MFDYPYPEIAELLGKSQAALRQVAARARRRIAGERPRTDAPRRDREAAEELARRFFRAAAERDVEALEALLAEDGVLIGDGGGKVPALARPRRGRRRVARTLTAWMRAADRVEGFAIRLLEVNGAPGAATVDGEGHLLGVVTLEIAGGRVRAIRSVVNPEKLAHPGPVADLAAALRGGRSDAG